MYDDNNNNDNDDDDNNGNSKVVVISSNNNNHHHHNVYHWFAQFLLEGKVIKNLIQLSDKLNDNPQIITKTKKGGGKNIIPLEKVSRLVSALSNAKVYNAYKLKYHWTFVDRKFLFQHLKKWIQKEKMLEAKESWFDMVRQRIITSSSI